MMYTRRYLFAFLIWVVFVLAGPLAFVVAVGGLIFGRTTYASQVFRAQDRVGATLLGFDGSSTVSSEMGRLLGTSRPARILCTVLGWMLEQPNHCSEEVKK